MKKLFVLLGMASIVLLIGALSAQTVITEPATVITESGVYILEDDLVGCSNNGIEVIANSVILDGQGHKISGVDGTIGILVYGDNVIVRNFEIDNFMRGIDIWPKAKSSNIYQNSIYDCVFGIHMWRTGDQNAIHENNLSLNHYGIYVGHSSYNIIHSNICKENYSGITLFGASSYNYIHDNSGDNLSVGIDMYYGEYAFQGKGNYGTNNTLTGYSEKDSCDGCAENGNFVNVMISRIEDNAKSLDESYALSQNYPNPFNPQTTVEFSLPKASDVKLDVFNSNGQFITNLLNGRKQAGHHQVIWDASQSPAGIYLLYLQAGSYSKTIKMTLLK